MMNYVDSRHDTKAPALSEHKAVLWLHIAFGLCCLAGMSIQALPVGWRLMGLVLCYQFLLLGTAKYGRYVRLWQIWTFVMPLSIFQVVPDWFLSAVLQTLVFPEDGLFKIGTVSGYMAGLWTIPMFLVIYVALQVPERWAHLTAAGVALLIFGSSEAVSHHLLGSWYAQNVQMWGTVAWYVLPAEALLGAVGYEAYRQTAQSPWYTKVAATSLVMLVYLGTLAAGYLWIERGGAMV
ncbi:DUF6989 domain-containing protein [Eisenibacter elegans]|uniref:DUF6989 domain-containing protein n=1 Tax=Eisenibacter elegans TaxID=997 RepID=UPI0012B5E6D2|nr:hypothetical protein [Eisenibacter elegans]